MRTLGETASFMDPDTWHFGMHLDSDARCYRKVVAVAKVASAALAKQRGGETSESEERR